MFSLLAKNQPDYEENPDTRSYAERVADAKAEFGIQSMSDEEIAKLSKDFGNPAQEAASHEKRSRRNAADTRTVEQQYCDAVAESESILH